MTQPSNKAPESPSPNGLTNHTPGPWRTDETEYSEFVFGPDGEMICQMRGWGYLTGERRKLSDKEAMEIQAANCELIASAPQLRAEVESARSELEKLSKFIWAATPPLNRTQIGNTVDGILKLLKP